MQTRPTSVIDLSHHNPTPIWPTLKAVGIVGIIHKATENTRFVDKEYMPRQMAARAAGLCWASYHFLHPGNIAAQMEHYIATTAAAPRDRLIIDFEKDGVTFQDLVDACDFLLSRTKCEVTVYGSSVLVEAVRGKKSSVLSRTSLWQARYSETPPDVPRNIWRTWSLWQFTDRAVISGIAKPVDGNRWNGMLERLPRWFRRPAA